MTPVAIPFGIGQYHSRFVIKFRKTGGDNTDDTFVPVLIIGYYGSLCLDYSDIIFDKTVSLWVICLSSSFPVAVILIDILPFFISVMQIAAYKKINSLHTALHSS